MCTCLCACESFGSLLTWEGGPSRACGVALVGRGWAVYPRDCGGGRALQQDSGGSSQRTRQGHGGDRDVGVAQITFENGNFSLQEEGLGGHSVG